MKPLLIFLPSRGRPDRIKECLDSYIATTDGTFSQIAVCLDHDDPKVNEYAKVIKEYDPERVKLNVRRRPSKNPKIYCLTRIINRAFYHDTQHVCPDREYYSVINDDMIFETFGWDRAMAMPWTIGTMKETNMIKHYGEWRGTTPVLGFPIISVIDARIIRALGWLQMPETEGCCGDNSWFFIGLQARNLVLVKGHQFTHHHCEFYKREHGVEKMDDTYRPVYANDNAGAKEDFARFEDYARYRAKKDIKMIKDLIQANIGASAPQEEGVLV